MMEKRHISKRRWFRAALPYAGTIALSLAVWLGYRAVHNARLAAEGPLPPELEGCDRVREDDGRLGCHVAEFPAKLVIWIDGEDLPESSVEATLHTLWHDRALGDESLDHELQWELPELESMGPGTRLVVEVDAPGVLEVTGSTSDEPQRWVVEVEPRPATPRYDAIAARIEKDSDLYREDYGAIFAELEAIAATSVDRWVSARALHRRAKLLAEFGSEEAEAALWAAYAATSEREVSLRCEVLRDLAEFHVVQRRYGDAEDVLEKMDECEDLGLAHRHRRALQEGRLWFWQRRPVKAVTSLLEAVRGAERLGTTWIGMAAYAELATALGRMQLHRSAEAALAKARARALQSPDCNDVASIIGTDADLANNRHLGQWPGERVRDASLDPGLASRSACERPVLPPTLLRLQLQLAYEDLLLGSVDAAAHALDRIEEELDAREPDEPLPVERLYLASIRGEISVARGDRAGLQQARNELHERLKAFPDLDASDLSLQLDLFDARLAAGRPDLSLSRGGAPIPKTGLERAEAILRSVFERQDQLQRRDAVGLSASRVAAEEAEPGRLLVEVQRQLGQHERAACTARLLRNSSIRTAVDATRLRAKEPRQAEELIARIAKAERELQLVRTGGSTTVDAAKAEVERARDALRQAIESASPLPSQGYEDLCDALPEAADDELVILFHQDPEQRWSIFEWSRTEPIRIHDLGLTDADLPTKPEALVELLSPLRDRLATAKRIRLLPSGRINDISFEALPWNGGTLEQSFYVTYGADLPRGGAAVPVQQPTGVVVACFVGEDCPNRTTDVQGLRSVKAMLFGDTSVQEVQTLSARALLLVIAHNSGLANLHVEHHPACTKPASSAELDLIGSLSGGLELGGTLLDAETILAGAAPPAVVLEGCATHPVDAPSLGGATGSASMYLAAGSQQVLATRRFVCAEVTSPFVAALLRAIEEHGYDLPKILPLIRAEADPLYEHRVYVP